MTMTKQPGASGRPGSSDRTLTPSSVISTASRSLPQGDGHRLNDARETVALIGHASMVAADFRLIGLGEDHRAALEAESDSVLPRDWNLNRSAYAFRYSHPHSPSEYLLQVDRLGNKTVVYALALFNGRTTSFDIPTGDFISDSSLPLAATEASSEALANLFVSQSRLDALVGLFDENIVQRLVPNQKEGQEAGGDGDTHGSLREQAAQQYPSRGPLRDDRSPGPTRPYPFDDPLLIPTREPAPAGVGDFPPPGFEDEHEINSGPRGPLQAPGGRHPVNIGERDLYPQGLAPHDPLRGHLGPAGGLASGGGMHPTFDDPMFGGRGRGEGGYDLQVPPGARYDPVGPGDGRPYGGLGPGSGSSFPRGRGPGPGSGGFGGFGGFGGGII
ncbi:hypothetical protein MferCBS31731_007023 [Microsporum ferrugineum]